MTMWKRVIFGAAVAGVALSAGTQAAGASTTAAAPAASAAAQGGSCRTWLEEQWAGSTTQYRAAASCAQIDAGTKVRGVLDVDGWQDEHTSWFTTTGTTFYSDWQIPMWGMTPSTRIEYGQAEQVTAPVTLTAADGSKAITTRVGQDTQVQVSVPADATGKVHVNNVAPDGGLQTLGTITLTEGSPNVFIVPGKWLPEGVNTLSAEYTGDVKYKAGSSNKVTVDVTRPQAPMTLTTADGGSTVTVTAGSDAPVRVQMPADATGYVGFYNADQPGPDKGVGTAELVNGVATYDIQAWYLPVGVHHISASYGGNTGWAANDSNIVTVIVTAPDA